MEEGITEGLTNLVITGAAAGDIMVFVKVRETYDLHTETGKCTYLGIHTPKANIIKKSYPGLLLQCKAYRPVSCDVKLACASVLPADPLQVGIDSGDIAPEDMFNPILYKAMSNFGMSQLEARINHFINGETGLTVDGEMVAGKQEINTFGAVDDEFDLYYGLLSETHAWKHAHPQAGLSMRNLKPLVYEMLYSVGDVPGEATTNVSSNNASGVGLAGGFQYPANDGSAAFSYARAFKGHAKRMPFLNTTIYNNGETMPGFTGVVNAETDIPAPQIMVGCIVMPPSRLNQFYYRMVVEWTLEFSMIRQISEITSWGGLANLGQSTHYKDYDYSASKEAMGIEDTKLENDTTMVATNANIEKVM